MSGESTDQSAPPLYLCHFEQIVRSYARKGTADAASRIFGLQGVLHSGARSGEAKWMSFDCMTWDRQFNAATLTVPQPKVSKSKLVAWVAGREWWLCAFTALGDFQTMNRWPVSDEDGTRWVFPALHSSNDPAKQIGGWLKALLPGGSTAYADATVELPRGVSAAGFRVGVCNTLGSSMPTEYAVHITGHDLRSISAFFEYFKMLIACVLPGAIVLAGWPAPIWGRRSAGPVPASIEPIIALGVDRDMLVRMINLLFQFDSTSPPEFKSDGSLWPLTLAAFASMVMWYGARRRSGEMSHVLARMRGAYMDVFGGWAGPAEQQLLVWAERVRAKFDEDNLHLTGRWISESEARLMASIRAELSAIRSENAAIRSENAAIRSENAEIKRLLYALVRSAPTPAPTTTTAPAPHLGLPLPGPTVDPAAPAAAPTVTAAPTQQPTTLVPVPEPVETRAPPPAAAAAAAPATATTATMLVRQANPTPSTSLSRVKAVDFFLEHRLSGAPPSRFTKQDRSRAKHCWTWFAYMASDEEKRKLFDKQQPDIGELRRILAHLHDLILELLHDAFDQHPTAKVPRSVQPGHTMMVNFIDDRRTELAKLKDPKCKLQETRRYFQDFRARARATKKRLHTETAGATQAAPLRRSPRRLGRPHTDTETAGATQAPPARRSSPRRPAGRL